MTEPLTPPLEFARSLNKAIRSFRMYSPTHPQVQVDLKEAFGWLEKMFQKDGQVTLGTREGVMIIQNQPVREMTPLLKAFCDTLSIRSISAFSAQRGTTLDEFKAFVDILVRKPEDVIAGDKIRPELLKPLKNIRLNELRFVALQDGVSEEAIQVLSSGGERAQEVLKLVQTFVNDPNIDLSAGKSKAVSDLFARVVKQGGAGEFIDILERLTSELDSAGVPDDERSRKMSQLFKLLPVADDVVRLRRVIISIEETDVQAQLKAAIGNAGFDVEVVPKLDDALIAVRDRGPWSALVADAGFRGAGGLGFLTEFAATGKPLPIVLLSWDESLKQAKTIAEYKALRFLIQPAEPAQIIAALEEIALPPEIPRATSADALMDPNLANELKHAQQIQQGLLPKSLPEIAGFELGARYTPAEVLGGDYYDVIELPEGRLGLLIADVAGKGVSAAMVMVMARTVFHAVAPTCTTARETVIEASEKMASSLPSGMYLTLSYAVFDPSDGSVSIANCGHIPPLLWTKLDGFEFCETVDVSGGAIGVVKGEIFQRILKDVQFVLKPGEQLVFYTDGVNEGMNAQSEEFGDQRLVKVVTKNGKFSPDDLLSSVVDALDAHRAGFPPSDDVTVLAVRRRTMDTSRWQIVKSK